MKDRIGLGPVFAFEWLISSRRWQVYAGRVLFVGTLLIGLATVWSSRAQYGPGSVIRAQSAMGESVFTTVVSIQLALVMLAGPAATAGAVCLDKARGTLAHVLVTDLSDSEIILGKLAARLSTVVGLVACTMPVTFICTLLGGIDPDALTGAFLITLGVSVLGCALALTVSVWASKTHEVLLTTYGVFALWLLFYPVVSTYQWVWGGASPPFWLQEIDPFRLAFFPYWHPGKSGLLDDLVFLVVTLLISAGLAGLSVAKVRGVYARQAGRSQRRLVLPGSRWLDSRMPNLAEALRVIWRRLPGPSLDGNPVLWREWCRSKPSRWTAMIWLLYFVGSAAATVVAAHGLLTRNGLGGNPGGLSAFTTGLQVSIGLLLLSVTAATALAEERVRGSLDVLLATPLSTRSIVWGKWWGVYRNVPLLAAAPTLLTFAAAVTTGRWVAPFLMLAMVLMYGAAITSLGLALATWVKRLGRAVALSVIANVAVSVGWMFLIMMISSHPRFEVLAEASSFFGPGNLTYHTAEQMNGGPTGWADCAVAALVWTLIASTIAVVLLIATMATFNRCMGRVSEAPGRPPRAAVRKLKPLREPALSLE